MEHTRDRVFAGREKKAELGLDSFPEIVYNDIYKITISSIGYCRNAAIS